MEIKDLSHLNPDQKIEFILLQAEQINLQKERIARLESQITVLKERKAKNSRNSSKPPSSDQNKHKRTESLREKSNKKQGGQPGHKGHCLETVKEPDEIKSHTISHCADCGYQLNKRADSIDIRQVFEIPDPEMWVIEHQTDIKECRNCGCTNKADFPTDATQKTQYGPKAKALMVYLNQYQLLPYKRIKFLFKDIFNHKISSATIFNAANESAGMVTNIEAKIKELLVKEPILTVDETGMNISGNKHWMHVASSGKLTHYGIHKKRGCQAMDEIGVLPKYKGITVHDHWNSYFKYNHVRHALCNAHHLRELKFVYKVQGFKWAKRMSDLLVEIYKSRKDVKVKGQNSFDTITIASFTKRYQEILDFGKCEQAVRGTNDSKNLLNRLDINRKETLLFMNNFEVPFSSNRAEQDIRMAKVQQKITGGFRTKKGADNFASNRTITSTAIKNGKNVLKIFQWLFQGRLTFNRLVPA